MSQARWGQASLVRLADVETLRRMVNGSRSLLFTDDAAEKL
jgi:hypothetical protein